MSPDPLDYLRHILDEAEYLINQSQGLTREAFVDDDTLKRAFVRSIEIIGEAVKRVYAACQSENRMTASPLDIWFRMN